MLSLIMKKDDKYKRIHPLVLWGTIKAFSDIFDYISKSNVAEELGKEKSRFNELIQRPYEFSFESVDKLSRLCELNLKQIAALIEPECLKEKKEVPEHKDIRYNSIVPMFKGNNIKEFKDIFEYVPRSVVAEDIGKKVTRFDQLEDITALELFMLGNLCELNLAKMFSLVKAQLIQNNKKP
jgi:hypothetical protein